MGTTNIKKQLPVDPINPMINPKLGIDIEKKKYKYANTTTNY